MPLDVYRWEEGGGLVHHCPMCQTPLSHNMCRTTCLGHHVEWCSRYHTQLFRIGWSNECAPCKHSVGQHEKRHREIAELLHQFKELQIAQHPDTQPTTPSTPRFPHHQISSPLPKKERKAARKAAKLASMPKVITTADIEFVANVLHPDDHDNDIDEERRLLEDPDIKLNLYYNKGTSNTRESRHRHIKGKQQKGEAELEFDVVELDAIMVGLKVPAATQAKTASERKLVELIRTAVRDDMVNVAKEQGQTQMRKAGFWRWASKKVYNRLLQNGRLWDQTAEAETPKRKDSAYGGEEDAAAPISTLKVDETSAAAESTPTPKENTPKSTRGAWTSATVTPSKVDDGWTQIGKVSRKPVVKGKIKLSGNGGLAKLLVKAPGMFGELGADGSGYVEGMDR
ncbi:hypothetical protein LTS10_001332 [Elasticomyces elasticus]|nr:hypothetical protein LTS10_001332 [Elasticomyces elasticus]